MNPQLTTRLRHLRLSGMVEALPGRVAQAEAAPLPHLDRCLEQFEDFCIVTESIRRGIPVTVRVEAPAESQAIQ